MSENIYLEKFILPTPDKEEAVIRRRMAENDPKYGGYIDNLYPARIFPAKGLRELNFDRVTILYGGNGSGKSTLLNLIAAKLKLDRISPYNSSELFAYYTATCSYKLGLSDEGFELRIPNGSRIITSDDVFDYMLTVRSNNEELAETIEKAKTDYFNVKYGKTIRFRGMDDYDELRAQVLARKKSVSRRQFIKKTIGQEADLYSNGETALEYFSNHLKDRTLYCLDEPENSLSPKYQLELKAMLEAYAAYDTQLIIATHSPFILAMRGARIYNLDESPVDIRNWWELENSKIYFEFFDRNKELFLG